MKKCLDFFRFFLGNYRPAADEQAVYQPVYMFEKNLQ